MGSRFAHQDNIKAIKEQQPFRDSSGTEAAFAEFDNNEGTSEKYYNIAIDSIVRHELNRSITEEDVETLAENIEANGLREAIEVSLQTYDGKHRLLSGERRWRAVQMLHKRQPEDVRFKTIKATLKDVPDDYHQILILINANTERENPSRLDEFNMYWGLKNEYNRMIENGIDPEVDFETAYIHARLEKNMKASAIKSLMSYYNHCCRDIFRLIDEGNFLFSNLKVFASLSKEMQAAVVDAINSGIKVNEDMLLGIKSDPERAMEIINSAEDESSVTNADKDVRIEELESKLKAKEETIRLFEAGLSEDKGEKEAKPDSPKKKQNASNKESIWDKLGTNEAAVSKKLSAVKRPLTMLYDETRISYNAEQKKQIEELIDMLQKMLSR